MKRRIVLWAGDVLSKDGDVHWITCARLAEAYGLETKDCVCIRSIPDARVHKRQEGDIDLSPRRNGDYALYLLSRTE